MRERPGTVIFKEYSVDEGDPYYPVPNPDNQALFEKYRDLAAKEPGVLFVGRLASYKCVPTMRLPRARRRLPPRPGLTGAARWCGLRFLPQVF